LEINNIIQKAKQNDQIAFKLLLHTFWNDVYGFLIKRLHNENDAEDITIQTFSKAFEKIKTFDEKFKFKTWLITIAKNTHSDSLRKQKISFCTQTSEKEQDRLYWIMDEGPSPEDKLITKQNLAELLKDIKKLRPHYQQVINLRYFQELSYNEISKEIQAPVNNVKIKLLRAKKLLAEIILSKK